MTEKAKDQALIAVGRVARPHGLQGEFKVQLLTDWPQRFQTFPALFVGEEGRGQWRDLERSRQVSGRLVVKLAGVNNPEEADLLRGKYLSVSETMCEALPGGYVHTWRLVGLQVVTKAGKVIGTVMDVLQNTAQDIYVVDAGGRELLIPAVSEFVKAIDLDEGKIVIDPIDGLCEDDEN